MSRVALQLLLAILLTIAGSHDALAAKRIALVIGNNAYKNLPVLLKAENDARSVAGTLKNIGFKVHLGENLTRRQTSRKLADFTADLSPGDQAFVFFAGHGVAIGAENYLIPTDMPKPRLGEEGLVRDEAIAVSALVSRVQSRGAAASFFVLDACRDNPFAATGVRSIGGSRGLARVNAPSGVFVLFSAGIGQTALDRLSDVDSDENSVFTRKLVPLLNTPGLTHVKLAKTLQREVSALAGSVPHRQQPAYYDQIIGEIVLRPAEPVKSPPATSDEPRPPMSPAAEAWSFVKKTKTASDLEAYIERFPKSFFADLARTRLKKIQSEEIAANVKPGKGGRVKESDPDRQVQVVAKHEPRPIDQPSSFGSEEKPQNDKKLRVHACDRMAADYFDRDRVSPAVIEIRPEAAKLAVKHCREAIAEQPKTARFRHQLAMALLAAETASISGIMALRDAIDHGSTAAMLHLGQYYLNGTVVGKDQKKAVELWRRAAKKGDAMGMSYLAYAYAEGLAGAEDDDLALSWAKKAIRPDIGRFHIPAVIFDKWYEGVPLKIRARYGHVLETMSETLIGRFGLDRGAPEFILSMTYALLGTSEDKTEMWRRRAARAGNTLAVLTLLSQYVTASEEKDAGQMALLMREAADAGDDLSKFALAVFYAHGIGVSKDSFQAQKWIGLALDSGFYKKALGAISDILKRQPTQLGFSTRQAGLAVDTIASFLSGLGERPGDPQLFYGLLLGPHTEEARLAFQKAAELGNETAHLVLVAQNFDGLAIDSTPNIGEPDPSSAGFKLRKHAKAAADLGNILGMAAMAHISAAGIGGPSDSVSARQWADKIVATGIVERLLPIIEIAIAQTAAEAFIAEMKVPAEEGTRDALALGGVARDILSDIFGKASPYAGSRLMGIGKLATESNAEQWIQSAAIDGDPIAMLFLGIGQISGPNPETEVAIRRNKKAFAWIRAAAERGEPFGRLALGMAYALGIGVDRNADAAARAVNAALEGRFRSYLVRLAPAIAHTLTESSGEPEMKTLMSRLASGLAEPKGAGELLIGLMVAKMDAQDQTLKWLIRSVAAGNVATRKAMEDDSLMAALR